jgi:hypothetical protein
MQHSIVSSYQASRTVRLRHARRPDSQRATAATPIDVYIFFQAERIQFICFFYINLFVFYT